MSLRLRNSALEDRSVRDTGEAHDVSIAPSFQWRTGLTVSTTLASGFTARTASRAASSSETMRVGERSVRSNSACG